MELSDWPNKNAGGPFKFEFQMHEEYFFSDSVNPTQYLGHTYAKNYSRFILSEIQI